MSRLRSSMLALAVMAGCLLVSAGPALAHGGEDDALSEAPARTLTQQALGLLTQSEDPAEAAERLEAALESEDTEGVALGSVRDAIAALERDDPQEATQHLNEALASPKKPEAEEGGPSTGEADEEHEAGAVPAEEPPVASEEALAHAEEFDPARGSEEWIGFVVGVVAVLAGLALLLAGRRRTAT